MISISYPFNDLTPSDTADEDKTYSKALDYAMESDSIRNIALTGPFGSGKSSILKTYEKNKDYKFLNISLATFKSGSSENKGNSEKESRSIERSILQQMLYGADANRLPYTRFKRIITPEHPLKKAIIIILWILASIFFIGTAYEWIFINRYSALWWSGISLASFSLSIPVVLVSDIYKKSFNIEIKKLSLRNAEFEMCDVSGDSILNRHLDEIIYFFQATNYDAVIIEDLDRFGNTEIFIKLREINKIINDNAKTNGNVKFIYAIKDDMFAHNNRAKFFDFIIPVVPIINTSNSIDKIQERYKKLELSKPIDEQLLRDVSLYINDYRLIHNIFNEFIIYYGKLKSESMDTTKLFALVVYKNIYPRDFERLHSESGVLFKILNNKNDILEKKTLELKEKANRIRQIIKLSDQEKLSSIEELIQVYIGKIILYIPQNQQSAGLICGNNYVPFHNLRNYNNFECLLSESNIHIAVNANANNRISIKKSFKDIEEEINPGVTFLERKDKIENSFDEKKSKLHKEFRTLEQEITDLSKLPLYALIDGTELDISELIEEENIDQYKLLIHLINKGYIDENYHLYISSFHEGRLTSSDRDYLLTILNYATPDPGHILDTPSEVCTYMRMEDFENKYALNISLLDYLLDNEDTRMQETISVMKYIALHFESSEPFISLYFSNGKHVDKFIMNLSKQWPEYAANAIQSENAPEHIYYILRYVEREYIISKMNIENTITSYLSTDGYLIFTNENWKFDDIDILSKLCVTFEDLKSLEPNRTVVDYSHKNNLYEINEDNIKNILLWYSNMPSTDINTIGKSNYTAILKYGSDALKDYVEKNIQTYIDKVLTQMPDNKNESMESIVELLNNETLSEESKEVVITQQQYVFPDFTNVPVNLWWHVMRDKKIIFNWENVAAYLANDECDNSIVSDLFNDEEVVSTLAPGSIERARISDTEKDTLSKYIINCNDIPDDLYRRLIKSVRRTYDEFPKEISHEKLEMLSKTLIVSLTNETLESLGVDTELKTNFIEAHIVEYLVNPESYPITDDVRVALLERDIPDKDKLIICEDISAASLQNNESASKVASFFFAIDFDASRYDYQVLSLSIINADAIQKSLMLLIKCMPSWDEQQIMHVISGMREPFSDIAQYGKRPAIPNDEINREFVSLLKEKSLISSYEITDKEVRINTFKNIEHSD